MLFVKDPELDARLAALPVSWDKSLLAHTRCPFVRAAADKLDIDNGHNLNKPEPKRVLIAMVDSVSNAGGGLGKVLAFFARFNHTVGLHAGQSTQLEGLSQSKFNLDQTTDQNQSDGTHKGGVEIISSPTGECNLAVIGEIRKIAGNSLTPETMSAVILAANRNAAGTPEDLAKSAGEWALMFCLLQDDNGDVPIADLEKLCHDARVPDHGWQNLKKSSTLEWVQYTSVITAHIAKASVLAVIDHMHEMWCSKDWHPIPGPGCGCNKCEGPEFWKDARGSIRTAINRLPGGLGRFAF